MTFGFLKNMKKQKTITAREIKTETIKSLSEKIAKAKTIVFSDYHGLTANQISQLRNKIKNAGGELLVAKNTLISRALRISKIGRASCRERV